MRRLELALVIALVGIVGGLVVPIVRLYVGEGTLAKPAPYWLALGYLGAGVLLGGVFGYLIGRMRRGRREPRATLQPFNRWRGQK